MVKKETKQKKTAKKTEPSKQEPKPAPISEQDKVAKEANNVKPIAVAAVPAGGGDDGSKVTRTDPRVDLQREQARMANGVGEYEPLLLQVTNLDHPVQANSLIHDMTELDLMRAFGLPESIYNIIKGKGMRGSGFNGFMRARMAILYPPPDGIFVHPRMLLFNSQRQTKDELKPNQKTFLNRLLAGEQ